MNFDETWSKYWHMLYSELEIEPDGASNSPLLAHYTSLSNLENILRNEQVWLSNPLFMNDLEEVRFGVSNGVDLVHRNNKLRSALGDETRAALFYNEIEKSLEHYGREHVLDLYVMCFSVHDREDVDGRLSMWRGYGSNGKGTAIVFDVSNIAETDDSPLALAPVEYASREKRKEKLEAKITQVAEFIATNEVPNEHLPDLANALFNRIALFAIFSKHDGFAEEQEWRLVYFKDRDPEGILSQFLSYVNGPQGLQPKLKLDVKPITGALSEGVIMDEIIDRIIVGPSASSPLTKVSAERMLRSLKKENLIPKLRLSSIPYRDD